MLQNFKLYVFVVSFTSMAYELITIAQVLRMLYCELNRAVCTSGFVPVFDVYFSNTTFT